MYFNTSSLLDVDTIEQSEFSHSIKANGFLLKKNVKILLSQNSLFKQLLNVWYQGTIKLLHIKLSTLTIKYLLKY